MLVRLHDGEKGRFALKCFACGFDCEEKKYCHNCGVSLQRVCPPCGHPYTVGAVAYCTHCGRPLTVQMEESQSLLVSPKLPTSGSLETLPCSGMPDPESALWARLPANRAPVEEFNANVPGLIGCTIRHGRIFALDNNGNVHSLDAVTGATTAGWNAPRLQDADLRIQAVTDHHVLVSGRIHMSVLDVTTGRVEQTLQGVTTAWGRDQHLLLDKTPKAGTEKLALMQIGGGETQIEFPDLPEKMVHADTTVFPLSEGFVVLSRFGKLFHLLPNSHQPITLVPNNHYTNNTYKCLTVSVGAQIVVALVTAVSNLPNAPAAPIDVWVWKRHQLQETPERATLPHVPGLPWVGILKDKIIWVTPDRKIHLAAARMPHAILDSKQYALEHETLETPMLIPFAETATLVRHSLEGFAQKYGRMRVTDTELVPESQLPNAMPQQGRNVTVHFCGRFLYLCIQENQNNTYRLVRYAVIENN